MKFSDLFLPKIVRSNPEVRKKAVLKTNDLKLLNQVVDKDVDPDVRNLAKQRIEQLNA